MEKIEQLRNLQCTQRQFKIAQIVPNNRTQIAKPKQVTTNSDRRTFLIQDKNQSQLANHIQPYILLMCTVRSTLQQLPSLRHLLLKCAIQNRYELHNVHSALRTSQDQVVKKQTTMQWQNNRVSVNISVPFDSSRDQNQAVQCWLINQNLPLRQQNNVMQVARFCRLTSQCLAKYECTRRVRNSEKSDSNETGLQSNAAVDKIRGDANKRTTEINGIVVRT